MYTYFVGAAICTHIVGAGIRITGRKNILRSMTTHRPVHLDLLIARSPSRDPNTDPFFHSDGPCASHTAIQPDPASIDDTEREGCHQMQKLGGHGGTVAKYLQNGMALAYGLWLREFQITESRQTMRKDVGRTGSNACSDGRPRYCGALAPREKITETHLYPMRHPAAAGIVSGHPFMHDGPSHMHWSFRRLYAVKSKRHGELCEPRRV
jgi:hypothetical protein